MNKTTFKISKMDCPSEEQMIRMKLADFETISHMDFDISNRTLHVYHSSAPDPILDTLHTLNFNTKLIESSTTEISSFNDTQKAERRLLWQVLLINFTFFIAEVLAGWLAKSMGLIADGLDMLADSLVYALALFAVGGTALRKKNIAKTAGYFQLILAALAFTEVIRRFTGVGENPDYITMIYVSIFALIGNAICLYLLQKSKSKEAHMQASMIFTSNDVVVNLGVIVAGGLVFWTDSKYPDLVVGCIVLIVVARGAFNILKLAK